MNDLHFHVYRGREPEAERLVRRFHYSHTCSSAIACVGVWRLPGGLFGDHGECIAACFFGWPPARWSVDVLELVRLVRNDGFRPPLTGLIAMTTAFIRRTQICDLLVSYADSQQGHHGGIYQAASWNYHGMRSAGIEGVRIDGQYFAGRQANDNWGTRSPEKLSLILGEHHVIEPVYDQGKHLYWKALAKSGKHKAKQLGLQCISYPKPNALNTTDHI